MNNLLMQENAVSLCQKLEESTEHINEICGELINLKYSSEVKDAKICHLGGQNEALKSQIKELVKQNKEREIELIHFSEKLEQHIKEWLNLLQEKDCKIRELQSQIKELRHQIRAMDNKDKREAAGSVHDALIKRETQIEILKKELAASVRDINFCMETIEEMSTKKSKNKRSAEASSDKLLNMRKELKTINEKLQITEKKLKNAEDDARMKAQKFSDMIIQLRQYEAGEYGLSDAVKEIKELRKQKVNSEKQLEDLSEAFSKHKLECSYSEEEKAARREEEQECRQKLQKSLFQTKHLEQLLKNKQQREELYNLKKITFSSEVDTAATQSEIMKLKIQLIHVLWVHNQYIQWNTNLIFTLKNLRVNLETIRLEMRILYVAYQEREKRWQKSQNENQMGFKALNIELRNIYNKLARYEDVWSSLTENSNTNFEILSKKLKQMSQILTFVLENNTKYEILQNVLVKKVEENFKLKIHLEHIASLFKKSIAMLRKRQEDMSLQKESLQDMLENSVPLVSIEKLNTVLCQLKSKYRIYN